MSSSWKSATLLLRLSFLVLVTPMLNRAVTAAGNPFGDGTADNEVDASEAYGDSPDAATGESSAGASTFGGDAPSVSGSGSTSDNQSGSSNAGSGDSSDKGSGDSAGSDPAGDADPGVKTEPDGSKWTGYY